MYVQNACRISNPQATQENKDLKTRKNSKHEELAIVSTGWIANAQL